MRKLPLTHGTRTGYTKHGCRCNECTKANADYVAEYRRKNGRRSYTANEKANRQRSIELFGEEMDK